MSPKIRKTWCNGKAYYGLNDQPLTVVPDLVSNRPDPSTRKSRSRVSSPRCRSFSKQNPKYVMRITGDDSEGVDQLSNFIDPESKYPVIVTTSRLLSTGVDAQTCRLIVLDREVGSMTEFKQIVGRGTRVHEDSRPRNRHCEGPFVSALA